MRRYGFLDELVADEMSEPRSQSGDRQLDEILAKYLRAVESGESACEEELIAQHPEFAGRLREFLADKRHIDELARADLDKTPADAMAPTLPPIKSAAAAGSADPQLSDRNEFSVGDSIRYFGDYELMEEIARGGMGVVYKARQVSLNRIVALKMILAGQLASEADVRRFHSEAEAAANLDHPGIVPIFEVGEQQGQHYFSMGFVVGGSLADKIKNGPLPPNLAAEYVKEIAEAVAYAHGKGVIHRDLKPGNVLIDQKGQLRVTDFGLAKRVEGDSELTATGQILGTPGFIPPEQAAGKSQQITESADVYSLGAILYALIAGRPPFQADNPVDTLMQVLEREPVSLRSLNSKVPLDLDTICLKCLEKDSRRRIPTAQDVADELSRHIKGESIESRPVSATERTWRWCKRRPAVAAAITITAMSLLVGLVGSIVFNVKLQNEREEKSILSFRLTDRLGESLVQQARSERLLGNRERSFELIRESQRLTKVVGIEAEVLQTFAIPDVKFRHSLTVSEANWLGLDDDRQIVATHGYTNGVPGTWIKMWDIESGSLIGEEQILERHLSKRGGTLEPFKWRDLTIHFGEYNQPNFREHDYPGIPKGLLLVAESNRGNLAALWNPKESNTSQSGDGGLEIWDLNSASPQQRLTGILRPWATFSPDDSLLAVQGVVGARMTVRVWELSSQRILGEMIDNHWPKWDQHGQHLVTLGPSSDPSLANKATVTHKTSEEDWPVPVFSSAVNVWRVNNPVPCYSTIRPIETIDLGPQQLVSVNASIFEINQFGRQYRLTPQDLLRNQRFSAIIRNGRAWRFRGAIHWQVIDRQSVRVDLPNEFVAVDNPDSRVVLPDPPPNPSRSRDPGMVDVPKIESVRVCQNADIVVLVGRDQWMRREVLEEGPFGPNRLGAEYANPHDGAYFVDIWRISNLERLKTIWLTSNDPQPVVIGTDGRSAMIGSDSILDFQTGRTRPLPPAFAGHGASWMSDSEIILGTQDGEVHVLDRSTFQLLTSLNASRRAVSAIDSNGQELLVGDDDGSITWYLNNRKIARWNAYRDPVSSIRVGRDGSFFISGSQSGMIKIWPTRLMREQLRDMGLIRN